MKRPRDDAGGPQQPLPGHIGQNIQTVADLAADAERRVGRHQRSIERLTGMLGRPATTYAIGVVIVAWTVANELAPRYGLRPVDPPPFPLMQGGVAIAALLIAVVILTTQNRVARMNEQRAHLDLQVNLIAEQKVAKLIALIEELRRDLPSVVNRSDPVAEAMTEALDLHSVATELALIGHEEGITPHDPTAHGPPASERPDPPAELPAPR
jgi:uncharacterized membrane protein